MRKKEKIDEDRTVKKNSYLFFERLCSKCRSICFKSFIFAIIFGSIGVLFVHFNALEEKYLVYFFVGFVVFFVILIWLLCLFGVITSSLDRGTEVCNNPPDNYEKKYQLYEKLKSLFGKTSLYTVISTTIWIIVGNLLVYNELISKTLYDDIAVIVVVLLFASVDMWILFLGAANNNG